MTNKNIVLEVLRNSDKPLRPGEIAQDTGIENKLFYLFLNYSLSKILLY